MSNAEGPITPAAVSSNSAGWGRINQEAMRLDRARASLDYTKPWLWYRWVCHTARLIGRCEGLLSLGDDPESCTFVFSFLCRQLAPLQEAFVHLPELEENAWAQQILEFTSQLAARLRPRFLRALRRTVRYRTVSLSYSWDQASPLNGLMLIDNSLGIAPDDALTVHGSSVSPQLESRNHPALKRRASLSATGSTRPKKAMRVEKAGAEPYSTPLQNEDGDVAVWPLKIPI
ncbi:hypothetical protein JOM56_012528 [Amanita muscaria]